MHGLASSADMLSEILQAISPLAVAFSGGLDSRFLAFAARRLSQQGVQAHLYFFHGPQVQASELSAARAWADRQGMPLEVLSCNPLEHPKVLANSPERCYHCKRGLFAALKTHLDAQSSFFGKNMTLCDGSNASDAKAFRPGLRALKELGVRSPLAEAGLSKKDIHRLAAAWGLDRPAQQARPCLLTRFAYGISPDRAALKGLDAAETEIQSLFEKAISAGEIPPPPPDFRLRLVSKIHSSTGSLPGPPSALRDFTTELHTSLALIPAPLAERLAEAAEAHGFSRPALICAETVSGFYDTAHPGAAPSTKNSSR